MWNIAVLNRSNGHYVHTTHTQSLFLLCYNLASHSSNSWDEKWTTRFTHLLFQPFSITCWVKSDLCPVLVEQVQVLTSPSMSAYVLSEVWTCPTCGEQVKHYLLCLYSSTSWVTSDFDPIQEEPPQTLPTPPIFLHILSDVWPWCNVRKTTSNSIFSTHVPSYVVWSLLLVQHMKNHLKFYLLHLCPRVCCM